MTETTIPVDLRNPGQVFACLGLMEVAEALGFDAVEGWFDWTEASRDTFIVAGGAHRDLLEDTIQFLTSAVIDVLSPSYIDGSWPPDAISTTIFPSPVGELRSSTGKGYGNRALPLSLRNEAVSIPLSNWLEGDGRDALKTFAGQQVAADLLRSLLGLIRQIFGQSRRQEYFDPFGLTCRLTSRFCFDSRGAWDALALGTSLDRFKTPVTISPLVEVLALIGLQNARPNFPKTYLIEFNVWAQRLPLNLARAALSNAIQFLPGFQVRCFRGSLGSDKQYKKCFPADEVISQYNDDRAIQEDE